MKIVKALDENTNNNVVVLIGDKGDLKPGDLICWSSINQYGYNCSISTLHADRWNVHFQFAPGYFWRPVIMFIK